MPLCTYFINGNCRFGCKCVNDHIDLKTLLKNEAEQVLNGKQWLLSCFGPFKESAVLPNFIDDQCFEEVRLAFLENSKNGNLQNYINNLMSEYNNALIKMNELKLASHETLQVVASIYNTSSTDQKGSAKPLTQNQTQNPFQSSNIFGGGSSSQSAMSTANIFGGAPSSNPFQQASSLTGPTTQQSPFSFSLSQPSQPKPSIFGNMSQQSSSIFNSSNSQPLHQPQPTTSIFGNQSNIFTQASAPNSTFGMSSNPPALASNTSIFGSSTLQQQPNQATQPQSIFGTQNNPSLQMQSNQAPTTQNIFGSFTQGQSFGEQSSIFGLQQPQQSQTAQNAFQQQQPQQSQTTQNAFQQQQQPATQNVFAQFPNATIAPNNQMGVLNTMTQDPPPMQNTNIFGAVQNVEQSSSMNPSPFQIQQSTAPQPANIFGGNPFQASVKMNDDHFYSKQEELSPEDIQAFQAENFSMGKIPLLPPSKTIAFG